VAAEEAFHAELCRSSGNAPLLALWQSLSRQLAVVWGLSHGNGAHESTTGGHAELLEALEKGELQAARHSLTRHIEIHLGTDFEALIDQRRRIPAV